MADQNTTTSYSSTYSSFTATNMNGETKAAAAGAKETRFTDAYGNTVVQTVHIEPGKAPYLIEKTFDKSGQEIRSIEKPDEQDIVQGVVEDAESSSK